MRCAHIVYCHPEPKSFVSAMAEVTRNALEHCGWTVTFSDLYELRFNPVADASDFPHRSNSEHLVYPLEQRKAFTEKALPADIAQEVDNVLNADLLVLVFPIFWYSTPAMLKGWIDRVFLSGPFYGGRRIYDKGGMAGKRALVVTSLGGREHMFGPGSIHGELTDGMLRHLLRGTLGYVGFTVYEPFIAYHVPYVSEAERRGMLEELGQELTELETRKTFSIPSVENFDNQFRPLCASNCSEASR